VNLFKLLTPGKDGEVVLNLDDVVIRGMTVQKDWSNPVAAAAGAGQSSGKARCGRACGTGGGPRREGGP